MMKIGVGTKNKFYEILEIDNKISIMRFKTAQHLRTKTIVRITSQCAIWFPSPSATKAYANVRARSLNV